MEIPIESTRINRWNIKRNSFPTIRNGNFQGNDSDSVCCSSSFLTNFKTNRNKLNFKKGHELGSGNFRRVVKAEAVGLKDADENVTTVAVKMVKPTAKSKDAIVALVRELKNYDLFGRALNCRQFTGRLHQDQRHK